MSSIRILVVALALACLAMAAPQGALAWGDFYQATTDLNVRSARSPGAQRITTIKKGARVKVDFVAGAWGAVFPLGTVERAEKNAIGYANIRYLKRIGPAPEPVAATPEPSPGPAPSPEPATSPKPEPAPESAPAAQPQVISQGASEVVAKVEQNVDEVREQNAGPGRPPVQITSNRMVYNDAKRTVVFEGEVEAVHADLNLTADTLTAYFAGKDRSSSEQIERIVAEGNVRVDRGTTQGRCTTLTYQVQDGILRMEGDPVLQDGENTITGKVIRFYLKDNRSEVVGGGGKRVRAVFTAPADLEP